MAKQVVTYVLAERIYVASVQFFQRRGLCRVCLVFPLSSNTANMGALVSFAMTKFNEANEVLKEHSKTKYHNDALLQADNFIKMMRFPEKAIASVIKSSRVAQIEYNRKILRSIVSSVIFCENKILHFVVIWNPVRIKIARIEEIFLHFQTSVQKQEMRSLPNTYTSAQEMLLTRLLLFRIT